MQHYRTVTRTNPETGKDESGVLVREVKPGKAFATEDGATYFVTEKGNVVRARKPKKVPKAVRKRVRKMRAQRGAQQVRDDHKTKLAAATEELNQDGGTGVTPTA